MKTIINVYQIMGNVKVGSYGNRENPDRASTAHTENNKQRAFSLTERMKACGMTRKKNRELLGLTDTFHLDDDLMNLIGRNGAVMSHLLAFSNVSRYARDNGYRIGYGEYCKRMKLGDTKAEWKRIRAWLDGHSDNVSLAMTIGVANKGYVYLRFLVTSPDESLIDDTACMIGQYLKHKRGFKTQELRPYEKDADVFIHGKYLNDAIESLQDLISHMPIELWEVMRASFALPGTHRTYKSREACKVIDEMVKMVNAKGIEWGAIEALGTFKYFIEGVYAIMPKQKGERLFSGDDDLEDTF